MSNLSELKNLTPNQALALQQKGIGLAELATAQPADLTVLSGVGTVKAKRIIREAQTLVNKAGLEESQFLDGHVGGVIHRLDGHLPPASPRIQRIRDSSKK